MSKHTLQQAQHLNTTKIMLL